MIVLKKSEPWLFWPSNICTTFPENPGNKILSGDRDYIIEFEFELLDDSDLKKTLFAILPSYVGLDINKEDMTFIITYVDDVEYKSLPLLILPNKKHKIKLEHRRDKELVLLLDGEVLSEIDLFNKSLGIESEPHIIFGAGNFPKNDFNLNYTSFNFYEFNLYQSGNLLSRHIFDEIIHEKSVDLTGNCNFIHKI